jgi:hypothetical protein
MFILTRHIILDAGGHGGRMIEILREQVSQKLKGHKKSDVTKIKMSNSQIGKKHSDETKLKIGLKSANRTYSDESKLKMSHAAKCRKNNTAGTVWITNGIVNKRVYSVYVPNCGWYFGRSGKVNQF